MTVYFDKRRPGSEPRERPREATKVKCSDCGKECEVPFKPTPGRAVYCRDCFSKHRPA
ncbi:TPA: hypothetical protein HA344_03570 [Candidatus Bathyarchaeota archaeon]|nr:hypothetical protein [Candidatus Bathyarchaeota archaeon]